MDEKQSERTVAMFRGRRASELTHEELLFAYEHAVRELERLREFSLSNLEMGKLLERTRRSIDLIGHGD
jgi:hypothetical protein